jgi:4-amino-4-deoxy-L-arabinose transferase-like glycosyltransferase
MTSSILQRRLADLFALPSILVLAAGVQVAAIALGKIPWTSDQSIAGLMARHIAHEGAHPIFYYGSYYGGTLEPHIIAGVFAVFGSSLFTYRASLVLLLSVLIGLTYAIGRYAFGKPAGIAAAAYLAVPPAFFLLKGLTSDGTYDTLAILVAAILFCAIRLDEALGKGSASGGWLALLGLFAGLAWWVHSLSAYFFVAVGLWFLAVRPSVFRRARNYVVFLPAFLVGSLPWWLANVGKGWPSLRTPEAATLSIGEAGKQFLEFYSVGVPVVFGARSYYAALFSFPGAQFLAGAVYAGLMIATIVFIVRNGAGWRSTGGAAPETRSARTLLLLILLIFSAQLVTSVSVRTYAADARFFLPIVVPIALLAGFWFVRAVRSSGRPLAIAAGVALLGFHFFGLVRTSRQDDFFHQPPTGSVVPLIRALDERGLRAVYTGYWTAYRLAFESGERIRPAIFGEEAADRYPAYSGDVDASGNPAVILHGAEAERFRKYLARRGSRFQSLAIGSHMIFWGFGDGVRDEIRRDRKVPSVS